MNNLSNKSIETLKEMAVEVTEKGHKNMNMKKNDAFYEKIYENFGRYSKEDLIAYIEFIRSVTGQLEEDKKEVAFSENSTTLNKGKKGEAVVKEFLEKYGWKVDDKTNDVLYRSKDTDFVISKDGQSYDVEVKNTTKAAKERLLHIELYNDISNQENPYLGWLYQSTAEYFIVNSENKLFIFKLEEMKEYVEWCDYYYRLAGIDPEISTKKFDTIRSISSVPEEFTVIARSGKDKKPWIDKKTGMNAVTIDYCWKVSVDRYRSSGRFILEIDL